MKGSLWLLLTPEYFNLYMFRSLRIQCCYDNFILFNGYQDVVVLCIPSVESGIDISYGSMDIIA